MRPIKKDEVVELAYDLLRIPSVNPRDRAQVQEEDMLGEIKICEFIAAWLDEHKISAQVLHYAPGRANCVAVVGDDKGLTLWLNGHVDTVAPHFLTKDSFVPHISGDRLYGIGAADMKGGIASMMVALAALAGEPPPCRVIFSAVGGEEGPPSGTEFLLNQGWLADIAIVGEPTHLTVCAGQRGGMWVQIKSVGRAGHGCIPEPKVNAVEGLVVYLYTLNENPPPSFQGGSDAATYNVGIFSGGHRANIIPSEAHAVLDIRYTSSCNPQQILEELTRHAELITKNKTLCKFSVEVVEGPSEPLGVLDEFLVSKLAKIVQATLRRPVRVGWAPFWSDAYYYYKKGIPAFIIGPGGIEQAHSSNEYVSITELYEAANVYYELALNLCTDKEVVRYVRNLT